MVDVSEKAVTQREATATGLVVMSREAFDAAVAGNLPKGDLTSVVRLAGVMGAKRTAELVPFCHPLHVTHVDVDVVLDDRAPGVRVTTTVRCVDRTGVEMEALTGCAVAALCVVDMVKAVDPWAAIAEVKVLAKHGGRSGRRARPA
jgi:cyclic pyranopterin phosphate synthase